MRCDYPALLQENTMQRIEQVLLYWKRLLGKQKQKKVLKINTKRQYGDSVWPDNTLSVLLNQIVHGVDVDTTTNIAPGRVNDEIGPDGGEEEKNKKEKKKIEPKGPAV
ncbi:hypothetical protein RUM43_007090 [Polyplax serrata]|uniref:Uncharacterized protein n=1 Tax=Polyplax serrata TaxID=468196 RepID=A0AAN8SA43_POLSC